MSRAQSTLPKKQKQLDKGMIKKFSNINKTLETYVATGFEPSDDLAGGDWYSDGKLDTEFIDMLKCTSLMGIKDKAGEIEMSRAQSTLPKKRKQLDKGMIKKISNMIDEALKTHIATGFEPSDDLAGGDWYSDGKLDTEFIDMLKRTCLMGIKDKAATLKGIWEYVRRLGAFDEKFTTLERIREIMDSLLLEKEVVKVTSTGTGEFALIPYGDTCYKCMNKGGTGDGQVKVGALA